MRWCRVSLVASHSQPRKPGILRPPYETFGPHPRWSAWEVAGERQASRCFCLAISISARMSSVLFIFSNDFRNETTLWDLLSMASLVTSTPVSSLKWFLMPWGSKRYGHSLSRVSYFCPTGNIFPLRKECSCHFLLYVFGVSAIRKKHFLQFFLLKFLWFICFSRW